jgi:hypothetical protein
MIFTTSTADDICGKSHGRHYSAWEYHSIRQSETDFQLSEATKERYVKMVILRFVFVSQWWKVLRNSIHEFALNPLHWWSWPTESRRKKRKEKKDRQPDREPVVISKADRSDHSQNGRAIVMPHCFHPSSLSSFLSPIVRSFVVRDQFSFVYLSHPRASPLLLFSPSSLKTLFVVEWNPSCNINEWIIRWCWFHRIFYRTVNRTSLSNTYKRNNPEFLWRSSSASLTSHFRYSTLGLPVCLDQENKNV